jgi:hypothetical protein
MELLDRYLQAVRRYLPARRQDDIIAELRANMESQIEDKESDLGRSLTQSEMEDLLRKMGSPVMVASRYQPQQYLIGPGLFPLYLYVLRVVLLWAFIVYGLVVAVVLPLVSPDHSDVVASIMRTPGVLINVAAWVTLIFVAFEFFMVRYPEKCPPVAGLTENWNPSSLPPVQNDDGSGRKPHSFTQAIAEVVFGFLFLGWLLLIPRHPFLLMGPGAVYLQVAPFQLASVWWIFFWWVVAHCVLQIGWRCVDLARGKWQYPSRMQRLVLQAFGLIPIAVLLSVPDHAYVTLRNPAVNLARYGKGLQAINWSIRLGLMIVCAIAVLSLALELGQLAWKAYRRRLVAG